MVPDPLPPFTAAILAGGRARRLGGVDKGALTVGASPILDRQLALLRGLTPNILIIGRSPRSTATEGVGRRATADRRRSKSGGWMDPPVTVVSDLIEGAGALGGLYTALALAPTEQVLVIACDMPFLTAPFLDHLVRRLPGADAVVPRDSRGQHPVCAAYSARIAPHLEATIDAGQLRVGDALAGLHVVDVGPDELARFDPSGRLLLNVNTPEDYERAQQSATNE